VSGADRQTFKKSVGTTDNQSVCQKMGTKKRTLQVERDKLLQDIRKVLNGPQSLQETLRRVVQLLHGSFDHFDWTGIYLLRGDILELSEYLGAPTVHTRIPVGEGICGAAVREKAVLNVPDVSADERYLACSVETKSELVVPIMKGRKIWGEIDIDSHTPAAFGKEDEDFLAAVADLLADYLEQLDA